MRSRILQPVIMLAGIAALVSIVFAGCGSASLSEYEKEVTALNELAAEKMAEVSEALTGGSHEEEGSHESEAAGEAGEDESHEDEAEVASGEEGSHEEDGSQGAEASAEEDESHDEEIEGSTADDGSHEDDAASVESDSHEGGGEGLEVLVAALEEAIESLKTVILELEDVKVPEGMEEFHRSLLAFYKGNLSTYEGILAALEPGEAHGEEETTEHGENGEESPEEEASHEEEVSSGGH